jgi:hypothetical protein
MRECDDDIVMDMPVIRQIQARSGSSLRLFHLQVPAP